MKNIFIKNIKKIAMGLSLTYFLTLNSFAYPAWLPQNLVNDYNNISDSGQNELENIRNCLCSKRFPRNKKIKSFRKQINNLMRFINDAHSEDEKISRSRVVGLAYSIQRDFFYINIKQLKVIFGKCKSALNGHLTSLNYKRIPKEILTNDVKILSDLTKYSGTEINARHWCIRAKSEQEIKRIDDPNPTILNDQDNEQSSSLPTLDTQNKTQNATISADEDDLTLYDLCLDFEDFEDFGNI